VTPLGEEDLDRPRGVERRVTAAAGRRQRRCAPSRAGLNAHRRPFVPQRLHRFSLRLLRDLLFG